MFSECGEPRAADRRLDLKGFQTSSTVASHTDLPREELELPQSLYKDLVAPHAESTPMLFAWWPKRSPWRAEDLAERCSRCLPGVRPNLDFVALPQGAGLEEHWSCFSSLLGLQAWQVVFFEACSPGAALREVHTCLLRRDAPAMLLYPMYLTQEMQALGEELGFLDVLGDAEHHELGPLSQAKGWLHPHVAPEKRGSNLRDALSRDVARGPVGYVASSRDELLQALKLLRAELPGRRFVLKPSWGSGGDGIVLDVTEERLRSFNFPEGHGYTAIVEELIEGLGESVSPTLYMLGSQPCGLLGDQVLSAGGTQNLGNRWPSACSERLTQRCIGAAEALQSIWNMRSNWGLDFVVDLEGEPVIVDINMGRPNGNFAVRLWESRFEQQLFLHTSSMDSLDASCEELFDALQTEGLLWDQTKLEGVLIYQYLSGQSSGYTIASAANWARVDAMLERFQAVRGRLS